MGQRLVITIQDGEEKIAAAYFHWSAYTESAALVTQELLNKVMHDFTDIDDYNALRLKLIKWAYARGGRIDATELGECRKLFPNEQFSTSGYSRNEGLIAVSENGIASLESWSEGSVTIDIERRVVFFDVFWFYQSVDDYLDGNGNRDAPTIGKGIIQTDIPFDDFDDWVPVIQNIRECGLIDTLYPTEDGSYVMFIA